MTEAHAGSPALSVRQLKGVGPQLAQRLARLGIHTIPDLLFHLPARYQDRTRVVPIGSLRPGDSAVVQGEVLLTEIKFAKRAMLLSRIADGTGSLTARFYHFNARQKEQLARGVQVRCFGEVRSNQGLPEMIHPEYRIVAEEDVAPVQEFLTPIYPLTEGVSQHQLRRLSEQALQWWRAHGGAISDLLPTDIVRAQRFPSLDDTVEFVHRPPPDADQALLESKRHPSQLRLAFEELLAQQLSLRRLRASARQLRAAPLRAEHTLSARFLEQLPFAPTRAQRRVIGEISADLSRPHPMQRLVQGDVGSGKTVVAVLAALQAVENGYQAAVMAPTELLTEQHFRNFERWLAPLGIVPVWLSGRQKASERNRALQRIAVGDAPIVVGTHALFQEHVEFAKLALVIIDEQHRFGVHQRLALREKGHRNGVAPHQLIMTATPIPRTLAMSVYADLDCSIIDELPPGRTPIETVVVSDARRDQVVQRIRAACKQRRQVYWVCTLIEESEALQCRAAVDTAAQLQAALPDLRVGLVHGRMKGADKEAVMAEFKSGGVDVLVATTVIEVGVDVPNASLIVIENAERLGLAQLHQLRGRVGRGDAASACVLMYHAPLSQPARARLAALRETNDGFEIARRDLELRGPGEVLGTRQTGLTQLRIADLQRDQWMLPKVAHAAESVLAKNPQLVAPLIERWIGGAIEYGKV
jgi:ATP-dependent DNA helicase RecG